MSLDYLKQLGQAKDKLKTEAEGGFAQVVQRFTEDLIAEMKQRTPRASGTLQQSITPEYDFSEFPISIKILAADYWDFINSGVDGVDQSAGAINNKYGTTYSFKFAGAGRKMADALSGAGSMQNWLASKGIIAQDGDYESLAYAIGSSIKKKGIKPSKFVNDSLTEEKLQAFDEALLSALENII